MLVSLLVIGGFVGFMNFESKNAQGTDVSGPIITDTIWDLAGSPYIVVGDVTVLGGITLTIKPGVEVKFDGYYSIYVNGILIAIGAETNRINITSNNSTPAQGDWYQIQINPNGHADIKFCNITYASSGIHLSGSSNNVITNNNLSNLKFGLIIEESSNNTITNNNISNNGVRGIYLRETSNITIKDNNFVNDGIYIHGYQLSHFNSHHIPNDNIINGKPLLYYKDSNNINIGGKPVGQVILANCSGIEVRGLQINNVESGIQVSYSNNIITANNNISSNDMEGIRFIKSLNNTITGNNVSNSGFGIILSNSSNSNITNNNVTMNNIYGMSYGIRVMSLSSNNNIIENHVWKNYIGIGLESSSSNNTVTGNNISNNDYGIDLVFSPSGNVIKRNTILSNNQYGIYFSALAYNNIIINNNISNGDYGVYVKSSDSNIITDNVISNNSCGCFLKESSNNIIINNNISNNVDGIYLHDAFENNFVMSNTIVLNTNSGIYFNETSNNNITGNNISGNYVGIYIYKSSNDNLVRDNTVMNNNYGVYIIDWMTSNNSIYHNNIINNTIQAHDETNNGTHWDNGYPSGGNYWSDFDESDEDAYDDFNGSDQNIYGSDGIVDMGLPSGGKNPYVIDADSQDNYPLINLTKSFIFLYPGWNLISIPHIQIDHDLGTVLKSIEGSYNTVWRYNASDKKDNWKVNNTSKPPPMNDLDSIDHKMGFWIHITDPYGVLFYYPGIRLIENQTITIHPGWNLVGYPSLGNRIRAEALNNLTFGDEVDSVWTYDAAIQRWDEIGTSDYFELGRGYWIHAKTKCVWDVPL